MIAISESGLELKPLDGDLIYIANYNSMSGERGDQSERDYEVYAEKILKLEVSDTEKQELLNKLHEKWTEKLEHEAKHVSIVLAGPARRRASETDHSGKILSISAEIENWFRGLEAQAGYRH